MTKIKQLTFGARFAPPRPTKDSAIIKEKHIQWITRELAEWENGDINDEEYKKHADWIFKNKSYYSDGFIFAKALKNRFGYDPDSSLVELLESVDSETTRLLISEIQNWIEDYNIVPLLPIRSTITIITPNQTPTTGQIVSFLPREARYNILMSDGSNHRIPYEDVAEHLEKLHES